MCLTAGEYFRKCDVSFIRDDSLMNTLTTRQLENFQYRYKTVKEKYLDLLQHGSHGKLVKFFEHKKTSCKLALTGKEFDYCKISKMKNLDDESSRYTFYQYLQTIVNYLDLTKEKKYFESKNGDIIENLDSVFKQELYNICNLISDISFNKKYREEGINYIFVSMKNVKHFLKHKENFGFTVRFFRELLFLFDKLDHSLKKIIELKKSKDLIL